MRNVAAAGFCGAVMCIVYDVRAATRHVHAVFAPASTIRRLAAELAAEEGLPEDWLNDGAKAYIQGQFQRQSVLELSNLRVWAPEPRYMLAMKCISARFDSRDGDDIRFLLKHLALTKAEDVFEIIEGYYPQTQIPARTRFAVEEILDDV